MGRREVDSYVGEGGAAGQEKNPAQWPRMQRYSREEKYHEAASDLRGLLLPLLVYPSTPEEVRRGSD